MFSWKANYYKYTREWILSLLNRSKEVYILIRKNKTMTRATSNIKNLLAFVPLKINLFHICYLDILNEILSTLSKSIISDSEEPVFLYPCKRKFKTSSSFSYFISLE